MFARILAFAFCIWIGMFVLSVPFVLFVRSPVLSRDLILDAVAWIVDSFAPGPCQGIGRFLLISRCFDEFA